jgi:PKD repeat protein
MLSRFSVLVIIIFLLACSREGEGEFNVERNIPPTAVAEADKLEGIAPLKVNFLGNKSTDDTAISKYTWDLGKDVIYNEASPSHLFNEPGNYRVELIVEDEQGLKDSDLLSIRVNPNLNEAPKAIAKISRASGEAPLTVQFTGKSSTDDGVIASYIWQFPDIQSRAIDTSYVFNQPGEYEIRLTVIDEFGLQDESSVMIRVASENVDRISCDVGGKKADQTGQKIWCWNEQVIPSGFDNGGDDFSNGQLALSVECSVDQIVQDDGLLHFKLNPTAPEPEIWCGNDFNLRSEIRTLPWKVNHPPETEEWFGWTYGFSEDYIVDRLYPWAFFQVHEATLGKDPLLSLWSMHENGPGNPKAGEIYIVNSSSENQNEFEYIPTGVITEAGRQYSIVIHVVWGDNETGLLQVWIDDLEVYNKQVNTIRADNPVGGNAKFGIYKWAWREESKIKESQAQGINSIHTFMGPLRIITRRKSNANYMKNSYQEVAPH